MADSMKHTLKRCDEIRDKFLKSKVVNNPFDIELEPHLIEIRTDDVYNDHVPATSEAEQNADLQRYDIVKFLERSTGEVTQESKVFFYVDRKNKDMLLETVLKPKLLRKSGDHDEANILKKRFKAVVVR